MDTVQERASYDPAFKAALFEEALQALFEGDLEGARELLRDCINATIGFQKVSARAGLPIKSVMRMVGPNGNPNLENFVSIVRVLQDEARMRATVQVVSQDNQDFKTISSACLSTDEVLGDPQMVEA